MRCPSAVSLGAAQLPDFKFEFKHHATVTPSIGDTTHGVLWTIQPADELVLDVLEGYPTYYNKQLVWVLYQGKPVEAMTYLMHKGEEPHPPSDRYYQLVAEGYKAHGLLLNQLKFAREVALLNIS